MASSIINSAFRKCDGSYYVVNNVANRGEDKLIIMTRVGSDVSVAVTTKEFSEDVSNAEFNKTHQKYMYEEAKEFNSLLGMIPTEDLVRELGTRHDNPYSEISPMKDDENVWSVQYLIGRMVTTYDAETDSDVEEFKVYTPVVFDTIEEARGHRDKFYSDKPAVIARRVISRVSEY